MTITEEQAHALEVLRLIADTHDSEGTLRHELVQISREYTTVRTHLIAAIKGLNRIDGENADDYSGHEELETDLRGMLSSLRSEEIALLELFRNMNEPTEAAQSPTVQDGSNLFANANDATVSGMSDTALLIALDGKAY